MDFKVIWSDEAITDLRDICSYIARDNPEAALRMGNGILDHVQILAQFPFIGPAYPRGAQGPLREIVFRAYRIFMMCPRNHSKWTSCMFGTLRATNRSFEGPNLAHALDAARASCWHSGGHWRRASDARC
jgi:plasmid stabilization system protein ParE